MKLNWLRLFVSTLIVLAALASAESWGAAASSEPCVGMSVTDQCPEHHSHGQAPRHCDLSVCGALQLPASNQSVLALPVSAGHAMAVPNDPLRVGFCGPPDLRPPIA